MPELPTDNLIQEETPVITESPIPKQEINATPIPFQTMSEEEINSWASVFLKKLSKNMPNSDSPFNYNKDDEQEATEAIKMLLGDFSKIKDLASKTDDLSLIENRKEMYYYKMYDFGTNCSNQMSALASEISNGRSGIEITSLGIATGYQYDFTGKDTIECFENLIMDLYKNLPKNHEIDFEAKANEILGFIYNIYFNSSSQNTNFNKMHPLIKFSFIFMANSALSTIDYKSLLMGINLKVGDSKQFTPLELSNEIGKNLIYSSDLGKEISALMDAYIYLVKSGQLTVVGTSESPQLIYTPSPKPE